MTSRPDYTKRGTRLALQMRRGFSRLGLGGWLALVFLSCTLIATVLSAFLPARTGQNLDLRLLPPFVGVADYGWAYVLGADQLGRPLLLRLVEGGRVSLAVGITVPVAALIVGVTLGLFAAYYGGRPEKVVMRIVDVWMSLPPLLLALAVLYVTGPGFVKTVFVLAAIRWMVFARVARGIALSTKEALYVEAAQAIGTRDITIIARHIWPGCRATVLTLAALESARAILTESALSFLGLGIQPPESSWGTMLSTGRDYMFTDPWLVLLPGLLILLTTLSINVIVDSFTSERLRQLSYVERLGA